MRSDQPDIAYHMPLLEELASKAAFVLELGVGNGNGSTRAFVRGLTRSPHEDRLLVSVEFDRSQPEERPDVPWWHIVYGDSRNSNTLRKVAEVCGGRVPDILFIDTDHTYDQMKCELEVWPKIADAHTVWLFHDTFMFDLYNHMTDAIKEYAASAGLTFFDLTHESHGLGMMKKFVGVNAGSGQRPFDHTLGWVNVDVQPQFSPDILGDMATLPFPDDSVDIVVSHHTIEHMGCGEADAFLTEAHRVLRRYGSLIVCVPNMRALAQRWLTNQLDTQIYLTNIYGAYMGDEHDRHRWGYDTEYLTNYLKKWKWTVKLFDWRPIEGADISRDWWILGMECVK